MAGRRMKFTWVYKMYQPFCSWIKCSCAIIGYDIHLQRENRIFLSSTSQIEFVQSCFILQCQHQRSNVYLSCISFSRLHVRMFCIITAPEKSRQIVFVRRLSVSTMPDILFHKLPSLCKVYTYTYVKWPLHHCTAKVGQNKDQHST